MKMCSSPQEYINTVAKFAQKACKRFKKEIGKSFYLPSVLIAQACQENGYGMDPKCEILLLSNNMVGIKRDLLNKSWTDIDLGVWDGEYINKKTPEVYNGVGVEIYDDFRIYTDVEQSFMDYLCFMRWGGYSVGNPKYYDKIKGIKDYKTLIRTVSSLGYATDPNYANSIISKIEKYDLTKYDDLHGIKASSYWPSGAGNIKEDKKEPTNSGLVDLVKLSPCNSGKRNSSIDRITPHCIVGQLSASTIGDCFRDLSVKASCNYGIGVDCKVIMCVPEDTHSWCSSSSANDDRAVTIECACDKTAPYAFHNDVYQKLIDLCTDICKRNGKDTLLWLGSSSKSLSYTPKKNEMVLTVHRWFANKSCPGDWMYARMGDLASKVTSRLGGKTEPDQSNENSSITYRVQVGAYSNKSYAEKRLRQVTSAGFDAFITDGSDGYYRVQVGAYSLKENALAMLYRVQNAGFSAILKEV